MRALGLLLAAILAGCVASVPSSPDAPSMRAPSWTTGAEAPGGRAEIAAAAFEGKVYAIGGFGDDFASSRVVEAYDPAKDAWTRGPDYPLWIHHTAAVGIDGVGLFVLGGVVSPPVPLDEPFLPLPVVTGLAYKLAPGATEWTPIAPLPTPRGAHAAAEVNGLVYVVGGFTERLELTPDVHVYDPAADSWTRASAIPTMRDHVAAASEGGKLYVVAGQELSHARNLVAFERFDPATGEWEVLADAPTARDGLAAVGWDGRILAIGGQTEKDVFATVEAYDPATDAWGLLPPLPVPRHGLGAAVVDGRVVTVLGGTVAGAAYDLSREVAVLSR